MGDIQGLIEALDITDEELDSSHPMYGAGVFHVGLAVLQNREWLREMLMEAKRALEDA